MKRLLLLKSQKIQDLSYSMMIQNLWKEQNLSMFQAMQEPGLLQKRMSWPQARRLLWVLLVAPTRKFNVHNTLNDAY